MGASGYSSGCKLRRFVVMVKANYAQVPVPRNIVTANWLQIQGKKLMDAVFDHLVGKQAQG